MTVAWRQFVLNLDALDPSAVEAIFSRFGASSLTLTDAGDRPVLEPGPGETPLWTDTRITGLFSPEADLEGLRNALQDELGLAYLFIAHDLAVALHDANVRIGRVAAVLHDRDGARLGAAQLNPAAVRQRCPGIGHVVAVPPWRGDAGAR